MMLARRSLRAAPPCCSSSVLRRGLHLAPRASAASRLHSTQAPQQASEFNEMRERSLLRHVISTSTEGNPDSVLEAMDSFWDTHFNGEGTAEWQLRGSALDQAVASKKPTLAMEVGAYCGYTAVRMGRLIPDGGKLISVEIDPLYAAIATKMVEHAGLNDRVFVEIGSIKSRLAAMQSKYGLNAPLDAVLLDHEVKEYLPDLRLLQTEGLITNGTVVLCDWSLYPGSEGSEAPTDGQEFMDYLAQTGGGPTARHSLRDKDVFTVSSWQGVI